MAVLAVVFFLVFGLWASLVLTLAFGRFAATRQGLDVGLSFRTILKPEDEVRESARQLPFRYDRAYRTAFGAWPLAVLALAAGVTLLALA